MRINSVSQNDAISKYINNVNSKPVKSPLKAEISDSVELSAGAQKFAAFLKSAKDSIDKSSTAEDARAADIMEKLDSNTYEVPTDDIVGGILSGIPTHI
ncbi:Anti-sigma-28 factor, FlgM [Sporobacter termitidis DSM 10068]|uniref:Anti-sigma-28 factor, FlgM n=1 Tax=Sporobacter termitidis DSM 10068 TaxID=1123282 RepID=A0A1M5W6I8_9FIRM|nr:flagellar biosynthesis anti-sigma factor FlgM [Sporobacter termitidis]SHH83209.1 Anti-sigma-28 factor, FlgM [Sporobacter termitidis DSM 10068]